LKKRLDVSFKHAVDMIGVKITPMRCLFFIPLQDSSRGIVLPMTAFHSFLN